MTPETTTQDDFLRRLAKALGWGPDKETGMWDFPEEFDAVLSQWWITNVGPNLRWLLTNDGEAYLVAFARAGGWYLFIFHFPFEGTMLKSPAGMTRVYCEKAGESSKSHEIWHKDSNIATTYAVAKMKGVPLPEGVE